MKTTDQIAAEAWLKLEECNTPQEEQDVIKSAVEEALKDEKQRNFDAEKELWDKARARIDELSRAEGLAFIKLLLEKLNAERFGQHEQVLSRT